jgi:cardiolipin synthase
MFDSSSNKLSLVETYIEETPTKYKNSGYTHAFSCGPDKLYGEDVARQTFINMISLAEKSIFITTPYLIIDNALTSAIKTSAKKGIDVRIVLPGTPDKKIVYGMTKSTAFDLKKSGVKIYFYKPGFIHAKQILIDEEFAFVGTVNLDYRSLSHHFENGILTYKSKAIPSLRKDFKELFKVSELANDSFKINKFTRVVNALLSVFRPLL